MRFPLSSAMAPSPGLDGLEVEVGEDPQLPFVQVVDGRRSRSASSVLGMLESISPARDSSKQPEASLFDSAPDNTSLSSPSRSLTPSKLNTLLKETRSALQANRLPTLCSEGVGGTYFLYGRDGRVTGVFKPQDEEAYNVNNPKGYHDPRPDSKVTGATFKDGVLIGEAAVREVAAYLLDHENFAGVPETELVVVNAPGFHAGKVSQSLPAALDRPVGAAVSKTHMRSPALTIAPPTTVSTGFDLPPVHGQGSVVGAEQQTFAQPKTLWSESSGLHGALTSHISKTNQATFDSERPQVFARNPCDGTGGPVSTTGTSTSSLGQQLKTFGLSSISTNDALDSPGTSVEYLDRSTASLRAPASPPLGGSSAPVWSSRGFGWLQDQRANHEPNPGAHLEPWSDRDSSPYPPNAREKGRSDANDVVKLTAGKPMPFPVAQSAFSDDASSSASPIAVGTPPLPIVAGAGGRVAMRVSIGLGVGGLRRSGDGLRPLRGEPARPSSSHVEQSRVRHDHPDLAVAHASEPLSQLKLGSFQEYVSHTADCDEENLSRADLALFPVSEVHKIAQLDIRLFNTDRHGGNVLRRETYDLRGRDVVELVPIDHGYALPETLHECFFEWHHWPQAQQPFSREHKDYIRRCVDGDTDVRRLADEFPSGLFRPRHMFIVRIGALLLRKAVLDYDMTPESIADFMCRDLVTDEPSMLEQLVKIASRSARANFGGSKHQHVEAQCAFDCSFDRDVLTRFAALLDDSLHAVKGRSSAVQRTPGLSKHRDVVRATFNDSCDNPFANREVLPATSVDDPFDLEM